MLQGPPSHFDDDAPSTGTNPMHRGERKHFAHEMSVMNESESVKVSRQTDDRVSGHEIMDELDSANKALSSNEQLLADEIERLKRHNHHATTSKYFGVRKRGAVVRAKDLTRQAAAVIITRSARTHFVSKRNKVSRFDIFLVARDLDKKHYGCWASVRTVLFAALYFTILVFQQQPQRAVSVVKALADMGDNVKYDDGHENWDDVAEQQDFTDWVRSAIIQLWDSEVAQSYQFDALVPAAERPIGWYGTHNRIIGGLLIRQWRYSVGTCRPDEATVYSDLVPVCYQGEDIYDGDESPYGNDPANLFTFSKRHSTFLEFIDIGRMSQQPPYNSSMPGTAEKALEHWDKLLENGYIDKQTRQCKIELCSFNANLGLFALQTFDYKMERGGRVVLDRELISVSVAPLITSSPTHIFRIILELIFVCWVELKVFELFAHLAHHGAACFARSRNLLSLVSVLLMHGIFCIWGYIVIKGALFSPADENDLEATIAQQTELLNLGKVQRAYNYLNLCCMTVMIFSIMGALQFHKRLAIVTSTLMHSSLDLIHVGVVGAIIVVIYAFAGYTLVGRQSPNFSSFNNALLTLLLIGFGEFGTYEEVVGVENEVGPIFFFTYILLVTVIMVNIVLAIVVDAFGKTQADNSERSSLPEDVLVLLDRDLHTAFHYLRIVLCCWSCRGKLETEAQRTARMESNRDAFETSRHEKQFGEEGEGGNVEDDEAEEAGGETEKRAYKIKDDGAQVRHLRNHEASNQLFVALQRAEERSPCVAEMMRRVRLWFPPPVQLSHVLVDIASSDLFRYSDTQPLSTFSFFLGARGFNPTVVRIISAKLNADDEITKMTKLDGEQHKVVAATAQLVEKKLGSSMRTAELATLSALAAQQGQIQGLSVRLDRILACLDPEGAMGMMEGTSSRSPTPVCDGGPPGSSARVATKVGPYSKAKVGARSRYC